MHAKTLHVEREQPLTVSRVLVKLFVKSPQPVSQLSPVLKKLLAPLSRIPPSLLLSRPDTFQARLPCDITIR